MSFIWFVLTSKYWFEKEAPMWQIAGSIVCLTIDCLLIFINV